MPRVTALARATLASGLSPLNEECLPGGASPLAALLLPQIGPLFSVVAPCQRGAALRNPLLIQRRQATSRVAARCAVVLAIALCATLCDPGPAAAQGAVGSTRLIVMPFESTERDPRLVWLREASAVLVSENLRTYGFAALSRDERVRAFHDLNLPADASLSEASVIRVGQLVGASDVITGTLRLTGTDLTVDARRIRLDTGRIQQ